MTMSAILGAALMFAATTQATAPVSECTTPVVPEVQRPVKPTRPAAPGCVDEANNRHTCSARVIQAYEARLTTYSGEFDAYVAAVNAYVQGLAGYVDQVNEYTQCEQRIVMPSRLITG